MAEWLHLAAVEFGYRDRPLLRDLSLTLARERALCVLGPSGVGKSTLIGLLAGHLRPRAGTIRVCGRAVLGPSPERPVVFQDDLLFPWMSALNNVAFGLRCAGMRRARRAAEALTVLERFGLREAAGLYPHQLSGGMRQRVGLARALAIGSPCVLLDEPLNAVDAVTKAALIADVRGYVERGGRAVVVTHELREAAAIGDAALVLLGPGRTELIARGCSDEATWLGRLQAAIGVA